MDINGNSQKPVILAVLAHPDDETFGMGGTLALYAQRGAQVYLVCATRGEVGDVDPQYMQGFDTIAERREYELRCAAQKLGLKGVFFLGYRDSGMPGAADNHHPKALAAAPLEEVADKVVGYIRQLRPEVVLTFDPIGGYRHPDHIAVHDATVRAFALTGRSDYRTDGQPPYQPQKLYFYTIPRGYLRWAVRLLPLFGKDPHHWGRNGDVDLASLAVEDFPVHAVVDISTVQELKTEASLCHESQGGSGMVRGLMGWLGRIGGSREAFMRAYPEPDGKRREKDLLSGIELK
jgi:N-acetyl-1-D-myo-inositol-2-amino-2-deoxy-alpha-D-glucopyranoside deacetylase